jgi:hypothetical protein
LRAHARKHRARTLRRSGVDVLQRPAHERHARRALADPAPRLRSAGAGLGRAPARECGLDEDVDGLEQHDVVHEREERVRGDAPDACADVERADAACRRGRRRRERGRHRAQRGHEREQELARAEGVDPRERLSGRRQRAGRQGREDRWHPGAVAACAGEMSVEPRSRGRARAQTQNAIIVCRLCRPVFQPLFHVGIGYGIVHRRERQESDPRARDRVLPHFITGMKATGGTNTWMLQLQVRDSGRPYRHQ